MRASVRIIFSVLFLILLVLTVRQGTNSFWRIHDNLDSEIIFKIQPSREGEYYSISNDSAVDGYMAEIPRNSYINSPFNLISLLFHALPASLALLIASIVVKITAFFGMYLFLQNIVFKKVQDQSQQIIAGILSLGFAFLPFFSVYGLAIPGIPLFIVAVLSLFKGKHKLLSWGYIILYGVTGNLVLGGFAVLGALWIIALWMTINRKENVLLFWSITLVTTLLFSMGSIGLFVQLLFDKNYISHRTDWQLPNLNLFETFRVSLLLFVKGQFHSPSFHLPIFLFSIIILLINRKTVINQKTIFLVFSAIISMCIFYGLYRSEFFTPVRERISFLKTFQLDRIHFLFPIAWIFLYCLVVQNDKHRYKIISVTGAFAFFVFVVINNDAMLSNISGKRYSIVVEQWNTYYLQDIAPTLKEEIPPSIEYRVAHYAINPAVGAFLGYQTIDGYHNNYPLKAKRDFQQLISPMLAPQSAYAKKLSDWGSVLTLPTNMDNTVKLDWELAREKKIRYIFSSVSLSTSNKYELVNHHSGPSSKQDLFVYQLTNTADVERLLPAISNN
jgi:hypothetical protein